MKAIVFALIFYFGVSIVQGNYSTFINFHSVQVEFGQNLGTHVQRRIRKLLSKVSGSTELIFHSSISNKSFNTINSAVNTLILSLGNTTLSHVHLPEENLKKLPKESFLWKFLPSPEYGTSAYLLVSNGSPLSDEMHRNVSFDINLVHYGAVVSAYASLE
eukprot:gene41782-51000_t